MMMNIGSQMNQKVGVELLLFNFSIVSCSYIIISINLLLARSYRFTAFSLNVLILDITRLLNLDLTSPKQYALLHVILILDITTYRLEFSNMPFRKGSTGLVV